MKPACIYLVLLCLFIVFFPSIYAKHVTTFTHTSPTEVVQVTSFSQLIKLCEEESDTFLNLPSSSSVLDTASQLPASIPTSASSIPSSPPAHLPSPSLSSPAVPQNSLVTRIHRSSVRVLSEFERRALSVLSSIQHAATLSVLSGLHATYKYYAALSQPDRCPTFSSPTAHRHLDEVTPTDTTPQQPAPSSSSSAAFASLPPLAARTELCSIYDKEFVEVLHSHYHPHLRTHARPSASNASTTARHAPVTGHAGVGVGVERGPSLVTLPLLARCAQAAASSARPYTAITYAPSTAPVHMHPSTASTTVTPLSACAVLHTLLTTPQCWDAEAPHTHPRLIVTPLPNITAGDVAGADPRAQQLAKVDALHALALENTALLGEVVRAVRVLTGAYSSWGIKAREKVAEKSRRPEILKSRPWFDVEHVRDALRFKARLVDLESLRAVLNVFLSFGVRVVQFDYDKFLEPKAFGWRPICIDLRFPNGLLVEFYAVPVDMDVKAVKHVNHELYERWRSVDISRLPGAPGQTPGTTACVSDGVGGCLTYQQYENAAFTSALRYARALWTWSERQGLRSWAELEQRYWRLVGDLAVCAAACEPSVSPPAQSDASTIPTSSDPAPAG